MKAVIAFGTDSDLGFIRDFSEGLSTEFEWFHLFPLNVPRENCDDGFISRNFPRLINSSSEDELIIIASHWNRDCVYWGLFSDGNRKKLLSSDNETSDYNALFSWKEVILLSCFSNGRISEKVKSCWATKVLAFWHINTELVSDSEEPLAIPQRGYAIGHFQKIIAATVSSGIKVLVDTRDWNQCIREIYKYTDRVIYSIHKNFIPECSDRDYIRLKPETKDKLRLLMLDFRRGIKLL